MAIQPVAVRTGWRPVLTAAVGMAAAGMAMYAWLRGWRWWALALGWDVGLAMRGPAAMLAGLGAALGGTFYLEARHFEHWRDHDEQRALVFLMRLKQLLPIKGTLAGALDEMGYRPASLGADAAEHVIADVAAQYRVASLTFLSRVALIVRHHGGSLEPVVTWAADRIQQNQSRRYTRQLEAAAQHATILVLAFAPWAVIGVFRLVVPSFYRIMTSTLIGHSTVVLVGVVTLIVFLVLASHTHREARDR